MSVLVREHEMPVIWTHGHACVFSSFICTPFLFQEKRFHNTIHVYVTIQMIFFDETTILVSGDVSQMNEIDSVSKTFCYIHKVVLNPGSQWTRAQRYSVRT